MEPRPPEPLTSRPHYETGRLIDVDGMREPRPPDLSPSHREATRLDATPLTAKNRGAGCEFGGFEPRADACVIATAVFSPTARRITRFEGAGISMPNGKSMLAWDRSASRHRRHRS